MLKERILKNAFVKQQLIAFRTEKEKWGETIIGHVKHLDSKYLTIEEIDEYGVPLGTTLFKIDAIINIIVEDKTIKCLEFLEKKSIQYEKIECTTIWGNGYEIKDYISDRIKDCKPLTLFVEDSCDDDDINVIGFIEEIDETSVLIDIINRYGEKDGKILLPLNTITGLRWESQEDNARWLLNKNHQNNKQAH